MNGRELFRQYARQKHNKQAKQFVRIENHFYQQDTLVTKDNEGKLERCTIDYKDMVHWIIKTFKT